MLDGSVQAKGAVGAAELTARYGRLDGAALLGALVHEQFPGRIAVVSSFGTESAVLLAMAAEADPSFPVFFINTGKLFGETLRYRDRLVATLGLTERGDYHHLNALKNLLSIVIAAVAIAVFVSGGVVAWREVAAIVPGVAAGGYSGVWAAKRLPLALTRFFVVAFGLFLACYYFYV